ncbi:transmembrane protein 121-like [Denticeps clupeoides]|uniref:Transmembrane protein 121-like n=1 Tax=Denticeps clupeoides TaxID=299321 RepID=A0A8C4FP08_9TELE|nr:transmembrane protein 121-like [Denticeps clupeoides]XP_028815928.1 transmembrane protein 121-like [Denticeps clupeoides]XP_028822167.1 transmembrane protein 121-like [Denticeps clupeoides]XP_028822168.1 transmembrane protein 121-like [Denticeps clupeoides]
MVPSPQICVVTLVTVSTMVVVDLYLLEQSMLGARGRGSAPPGLWSSTAVVLGDVSFLLVLRYVLAGVGTETSSSSRRGFSSTLWFLFLSVLQLKLFFVCENYRQEWRPPDPLARKTLTLLLSVGLPSLFLILAGSEHLTPPRLLWVVVDLLDVLDLQAGLWEVRGPGSSGPVPLWAEGLVFFYCYILLLLLPCVSLAELGTSAPAWPRRQPPGLGDAPRRHEAIYPWLSLVAINLLTLLIRGGGMLWYRDPRVSAIFLGKNMLALAMKLSSVWDSHREDAGNQGPKHGGNGARGRQPWPGVHVP